MTAKCTSVVLVIFIMISLGSYCSVNAQVSIRPYTQVYSENLRGSCVLFGNTSMNIVDADTISTLKTDETGNPLNGVGGLGYSRYGNDFENMQFTDIDVTPADVAVFGFGAARWNYLADGSDQGMGWLSLNDPDVWSHGTASFGYGYAQQTTIPGGNVTTYFLKTVNITDPALYTNFNFTYSYDDGIVIYVNGHEVIRSNMPAGGIAYNTVALTPNYTTNETFSISSAYFTPGANIIAVEVHQSEVNSSNCYFDMALKGIARSTYNSSSADLILPA